MSAGMTEQELRALVRDAIARHAGGARRLPRPSGQARSDVAIATCEPWHVQLSAGADTGGPCVIEPAVACNHCGYCKSYGH